MKHVISLLVSLICFSLQAMNENDFCRLQINVAHQGKTECIDTPFWVSKKEIKNPLYCLSPSVSIEKQKEALRQLINIACPVSVLVFNDFDQAMVLTPGVNLSSEERVLGVYDHLGKVASVQFFLDYIKRRTFFNQDQLSLIVNQAVTAVLEDPSIINNIMYKGEYELMKNQFKSIEAGEQKTE